MTATKGFPLNLKAETAKIEMRKAAPGQGGQDVPVLKLGLKLKMPVKQLLSMIEKHDAKK